MPGRFTLLQFLLVIYILFAGKGNSFAQKIQVPKVLSNISVDNQGVHIENKGNKIYAISPRPSYTHENFTGNITGSAKGIHFNFKQKSLNGLLYYGFIPINDSKYPQPVYFSNVEKITEGYAEISVKDMKGKFDMISWMEKERGIMGYRVMNGNNNILYDGKINFIATEFLETDGVTRTVAYGQQVPVKPNPFRVDQSLIEGPFIARLKHDGATIQLKTHLKGKIIILVNGKKFTSKGNTLHEIAVTDLEPDTNYEYDVLYGSFAEEYSFRTAPTPGSRTAFSFAYASDSRSGNGGGERNLYGVNVYIMKKIMALNMQEKVRFMQFSGDMITGYRDNPDGMQLEYINWKRAIEPFARYIPVITAMGNHEASVINFFDPVSKFRYQVDKFPYDKVSSEAIYQKEFVNPLNGPESEDGSVYDPDESTIDFPSYKESVFYYIYDNIAMVVLNSDYWYTPSVKGIQVTGGNIHGYVMDNQLEWFGTTMKTLENDPNLDHIFVTIHTPFFPNGGHVHDDMWYNGDNSFRPVIAGKSVEKGIIERRDELLDIIVNKSKKVKAILTGDEHNYARTLIGPGTNIYPDKYMPEKITLSREVWQINNGAAGAPYYAQEETPWSEYVQGFTTQNALVIFDIEGETIKMRVLNPDTLEEVDELDLN
jgi:hypothetical protein